MTATVSRCAGDPSSLRMRVARNPRPLSLDLSPPPLRYIMSLPRQHCSRLFQMKQEAITHEAVLRVMESPFGMSRARSDFHWRPQAWACGSIHRFIHRFHVVPFSSLRAGICAVLDCANVTGLFEKRAEDRHITNASVTVLTPSQYERLQRWYHMDYALLKKVGNQP